MRVPRVFCQTLTRKKNHQVSGRNPGSRGKVIHALTLPPTALCLACNRWRSCQFYTANTAVSLMDRAGTAIFSGITGCRVLPELDVHVLNLHRADAAASQIGAVVERHIVNGKFSSCGISTHWPIDAQI